MAHHSRRIIACWTVVLALMVGLLGACTTSREPGVVTGTGPASQTVSYSHGQYRLYGSGTDTSPYFWVWVPTAATAPPPPTNTSNSTVTYQGGRYQLRGNGTATSAYYWVWVPAGSAVEFTVPPPPSLPVRSASVAQAGGSISSTGTARRRLRTTGCGFPVGPRSRRLRRYLGRTRRLPVVRRAHGPCAPRSCGNAGHL